MSESEQDRKEAAKMMADLGFLSNTKLELNLLQWGRETKHRERQKRRDNETYNSLNCGADILGHNIATVQQGTSHVLSFAWITDDHLVTLLETRESHIRHRILLMTGFICRKDRCVCRQWEVNTGEPEYQRSDKVVKVRVKVFRW